MMKKLSKILTIALLSAMLVATAPVTLAQDTSSLSIVIADTSTFKLSFIRETVDFGSKPTYTFIGAVHQCNSIANVDGMLLYSVFDSSAVVMTKIAEAIHATNDSCAAEFFVFEIDGYVLRDQLDKIDLCVIVLHSQLGYLNVPVSWAVEQLLLEQLPKQKTNTL